MHSVCVCVRARERVQIYSKSTSLHVSEHIEQLKKLELRPVL